MAVSGLVAGAIRAPARTRKPQPPAVEAALIQALVAMPMLAGLSLLEHVHHAPPIAGAALLQGALAALLTYRSGLAPWWRPIQLLFPVALLGARTLHLPPLALFAPFTFLLFIFWSTFRAQVPFYPSGPAVWRAVAGLLPVDGPVPMRFIDIGSGIGGLVLDLARRRPDATFGGVETAPLTWFVSVLRARLTASNVRFVRADYERLHFADYDVVFAYLSPVAMPSLWRKASAEMRPSTMLVSYEFSITAKAPDRVVEVAGRGPALYVWYF